MRKLATLSSRFVGAALLVIVLLPAAPRLAQAQDAAAFINNLGNQGLQALSHAVPQEQRAARFRQILDSDFDIPGASQFVLGSAARSLDPQQQQEFTSLFREYLVRAYTQRLSQYAGGQFRVVGVRPHGGEEVVASQVVGHGGNPVNIDWHVVNHGGRWLVSDVVVDNVSMKVTHRNEFAAIIQRNGGRPDALVAALRQQLQGPATRTGTSAPPSSYPAR